jgi:hypothetical protein
MIIAKEHIPDIQISDTQSQSKPDQTQYFNEIPFIQHSPFSKLQKILSSPANQTSAQNICLILKDVSLTNLITQTTSAIPYPLPISEFSTKYGRALYDAFYL